MDASLVDTRAALSQVAADFDFGSSFVVAAVVCTAGVVEVAAEMNPA